MPSSTFLAASLSFMAQQLLNHCFRLLTGGFFALLRMDRLKHFGYQLYFGTRRYGEHIAVKVDGAPLVFVLGEYLVGSLKHTLALIANNQFYTIQSTITQPLKEAPSNWLCPPSCLLRHPKPHDIRPH